MNDLCLSMSQGPLRPLSLNIVYQPERMQTLGHLLYLQHSCTERVSDSLILDETLKNVIIGLEKSTVFNETFAPNWVCISFQC